MSLFNFHARRKGGGGVGGWESQSEWRKKGTEKGRKEWKGKKWLYYNGGLVVCQSLLRAHQRLARVSAGESFACGYQPRTKYRISGAVSRRILLQRRRRALRAPDIIYSRMKAEEIFSLVPFAYLLSELNLTFKWKFRVAAQRGSFISINNTIRSSNASFSFCCSCAGGSEACRRETVEEKSNTLRNTSFALQQKAFSFIHYSRWGE